jgi:hypothetical protein
MLTVKKERPTKGPLIPRLYSKLQASKELRAMSDISRLSDAELIQQY